MFGIEFGDNLHGYSVIALYAQNAMAYVLAYHPGNEMPYATWKVCGHGLFLESQLFPDRTSAYAYLKSRLLSDKSQKMHARIQLLHIMKSRKRELPMNLFYLRLPTLQDLHVIREKLTWEQYNNLFAPAFCSNFHIKDTNTLPWKEKVGFRPVLEASIPSELSIIYDGTVIRMDCPELDKITFLPNTQPVAWVKCDNLLIACQELTDDIPYEHLVKEGLLSGLPFRVDFDQAVSSYFYLQNTRQPESDARLIGTLMYRLQLVFASDAEAPETCASKLYAIAKKVHSCWLTSSTLDMDTVMMAASQLYIHGIPDLEWPELLGNDRDWITAAVVQQTLCTCEQSVFNTLIDLSTDQQVNFALIDDTHRPTALFQALLALAQTADKLSEQKDQNQLLQESEVLSESEEETSAVKDQKEPHPCTHT